MKKSKSISPTMKILKDSGFIKITYRKGVGARGLQEWFPTKGDFSVSKNSFGKTFTLEISESETLEKIYNCLIDNSIKVNKENNLRLLEVFY